MNLAEEGRVHAIADALAAEAGANAETLHLGDLVPTALPQQRWVPDSRDGVAHLAPTVPVAQQLLKDFHSYLVSAGIAFDTSTSVDLLAAYLSSQFVLFAGPSGTGKSTAARALGHIFCTRNSFGVVEGRRQMIGPEDLVGYYSPLSKAYVAVGGLKVLLQLAVPAPDASPALLVEEINLSPVEGYLAPFTHAMSGLATSVVPWELHDATVSDPPSQLGLAPYPRLVGTINVDATAMAPAPKVTARACVVLLEPPESTITTSVLQQLNSGPGDEAVAKGAGAALVGDPREIFAAAVTDDEAITKETNDAIDLIRAAGRFAGEAGAAGTMPNPVSRRQVTQLLTYVSWFVLLARGHEANGGTIVGGTDPHRLGVENALLHYVLPTLPGVEFGLALQRLQAAGDLLAPSPTDPSELGAVLRTRIERLAAAGADALGLGRALDFWDRLS